MMLYPPRLLLLVTSPLRAMELCAFGHLLLALFGTYLLCRRLGGSRAFAAIGAIVFVCAALLPWLLIPSLSEPAAWLPLIALMVVEILSGGGWVWVPALGAAAAMPVLAGNAQIALYVAYAIAILGFAVLIEQRARRRPVAWRRVGWLVAAGALAVCTSPRLSSCRRRSGARRASARRTRSPTSR